MGKQPSEANRNTRYWETLAKTDPKHTKKFSRSGGFSGTAIKPIYATEKMTELFGPCGVGWGIEKPDFSIIDADKEKLVFCTVAIWFLEGQSRSSLVYGVGGDKIVSTRKTMAFTDDEAFKKAFTDAIGNAMKQIGMSADVHMGQFDDSKYVNELTKEFADDKPAAHNNNDEPPIDEPGSTEPDGPPILQVPGEKATPQQWKAYAKIMAEEASQAPSAGWLGQFRSLNKTGMLALGKASNATSIWLVSQIDRVAERFTREAA